MLGKRMRLSMSESAYWRKFAGERSPEELESGLQLVHNLFTTNIKPPRNEDLKTVIEYAFSDADFLVVPLTLYADDSFVSPALQ